MTHARRHMDVRCGVWVRVETRLVTDKCCGRVSVETNGVMAPCSHTMYSESPHS